MTLQKSLNRHQEEEKFRNRKNRLKDFLTTQRAATTTLENRTGVYKVKVEGIPRAPTSRRLEELARPRALVQDLLKHSDTSGLLVREHLESFRRFRELEPTVSVHEKSNQVEVYDKQLDEIKEHELELNEFNRKFGKVKGRVGFPKIHLENFMQKELF